MIEPSAAATIQVYADAHASAREPRFQIGRVMCRLRQVDQFGDRPHDEQSLRKRADLRRRIEEAGVLDLLQKTGD